MDFGGQRSSRSVKPCKTNFVLPFILTKRPPWQLQHPPSTIQLQNHPTFTSFHHPPSPSCFGHACGPACSSFPTSFRVLRCRPQEAEEQSLRDALRVQATRFAQNAMPLYAEAARRAVDAWTPVVGRTVVTEHVRNVGFEGRSIAERRSIEEHVPCIR